MNLVPELIEVPNEPVRMALYGRPGIKYFTGISPGKIRAMWAGGGRLFVVNHGTLYEVLQSGAWNARTGTLAELAVDPDPAQVFSNGHQLMIVSGHQVYCDNGSGPVAVKQIVSGNGNTHASAGSLVWINPKTGMEGTGTPPGPFLPAWNGGPVRVADVWYTMTYVNDHTLLLTPTPPDATLVPWATPQGPLLDGVTGGFLDGYFIVNRVPRPDLPQTQDPGRQFNISDLNDGTMWDPLNFAIKEGRSDYINSILCDHEQLILFGTESMEVWQNVGALEFPFQRIPGAYIQDGSVAIYAPCSVGPTFMWLGGGPNGQTRAYRADGLQPVRISTHAEEWAWNAPGFRVNDAVSYAYINAGHLHWVVNFWQQQHTWVYDTNTGLWHERAAWDKTNQIFLRYKPWYHVFIPEWGDGGKHIVGEVATGSLYELSSNLFDDDGQAIEYVRAFPHLLNENQFSYHHRLEVLIEMGALQPTDPIPFLGLDWSDDHGHTFVGGYLARLMPMAASGNFTRRAVFRRLGKSRDRVYRVATQARTKIALIDTFLEATSGFA